MARHPDRGERPFDPWAAKPTAAAASEAAAIGGRAGTKSSFRPSDRRASLAGVWRARRGARLT